MECIICLNDISNNDFIVLECCKQNIHIDCLKQWINTNYNKNTDISLCIYCKNKNNIINDMIKNIVIDIEERTSDASNVSIITQYTNIPIYNNNARLRIVSSFTIFFLFFSMGIIFLLLF
tara:strand:- start:877 stop:1236 length:360 start_codon:yes stop_codon:yes gene_type:complete